MNIDQVYFEKYEILKLLGQGGTSEVYLARNQRLGSFVAIKKANKSTEHLNLLAEPNILKDLDHPMIPKIMDIEEDEAAIYLIEEYVAGTNLKELKRTRETIEEPLIIEWALQLCDVLKYLHTRQPHPIIYRDLKPENIILMPGGRLKLIDFGIARQFKQDHEQDTIPIGTRGYAAPEQYGIGQSDERTDLFALGMTLYFLFTNQNLTNSPYQIQVTQQLNNRASTAMQALIAKCCEVLPNQRFQKADEVEAALFAMKAVEPGPKTSLSKNRPRRSFSVFKNEKRQVLKGKATVGMMGVCSGSGVTHAAIMLATSLARHQRVAVLEMNPSKHFMKIAEQMEDERGVKEAHLIYERVHYFWDIGYESFLMYHREDFDVVILDLGAYGTRQEISDIIRADIQLVVGQGMDWKIEELRRFVMAMENYDPNHRFQYLVPFLDKKALGRLKLFQNNRHHPLPFNMNPFAPGAEVVKILEQVMQTN